MSWAASAAVCGHACRSPAAQVARLPSPWCRGEPDSSCVNPRVLAVGLDFLASSAWPCGVVVRCSCRCCCCSCCCLGRAGVAWNKAVCTDTPCCAAHSRRAIAAALATDLERAGVNPVRLGEGGDGQARSAVSAGDGACGSASFVEASGLLAPCWLPALGTAARPCCSGSDPAGRGMPPPASSVPAVSPSRGLDCEGRTEL